MRKHSPPFDGCEIVGRAAGHQMPTDFLPHTHNTVSGTWVPAQSAGATQFSSPADRDLGQRRASQVGAQGMLCAPRHRQPWDIRRRVKAR